MKNLTRIFTFFFALRTICAMASDFSYQENLPRLFYTSNLNVNRNILEAKDYSEQILKDIDFNRIYWLRTMTKYNLLPTKYELLNSRFSISIKHFDKNSQQQKFFIGDLSELSSIKQLIEVLRSQDALNFVPLSTHHIFSYINDAIICTNEVDSKYMPTIFENLLQSLENLTPEKVIDRKIAWKIIERSIEYVDIDYEKFMNCFNDKEHLYRVNKYLLRFYYGKTESNIIYYQSL